MERRTRAFSPQSCVRCKRLNIRTDGLPLCSECEKHLTEKAARILADTKLGKAGKLELVSDATVKE